MILTRWSLRGPLPQLPGRPDLLCESSSKIKLLLHSTQNQTRPELRSVDAAIIRALSPDFRIPESLCLFVRGISRLEQPGPHCCNDWPDIENFHRHANALEAAAIFWHFIMKSDTGTPRQAPSRCPSSRCSSGSRSRWARLSRCA